MFMFLKNKHNIKWIIIISIIVFFFLGFCYDFWHIQKIITSIEDLTNPAENRALPEDNNGTLKNRLIFFIFRFFGKITLVAFIISFLLHLKKNNQIKRFKEKLALWSKLSFHVSQVGEEVLNELPIGIVLIDVNTKEIQWLNPYANFILKHPEINTPLGKINESMLLLTETQDEKTIIALEQKNLNAFTTKN